MTHLIGQMTQFLNVNMRLSRYGNGLSLCLDRRRTDKPRFADLKYTRSSMFINKHSFNTLPGTNP
jgi:hypothetical protein